jgi:biopolymer transport protein ExbD
VALGRIPGGESVDEEAENVFAEINITPLTDIFLVLLVIFMVTSSVIVNQGQGAQGGLKVTLPKGGQSDVKPTAKDLSIAVLTDGSVVVAGEVVSMDGLRTVLEKAQADNPGTLVVVQADQGVAHGKVVEVMELAKGAGLEQLAIGVREAK